MGRVTRACNGCRVRKVRCNGEQPCSQCAHLNLSCNFAPAPGKRKPGIRGRLVAQLRENPNSSVPDSSPNGSDALQPQGGSHDGGANITTIFSDNSSSNNNNNHSSNPNSLRAAGSAALSSPTAAAGTTITAPSSVTSAEYSLGSPSLFEALPAPDAAGYTPAFFTSLLAPFEQHVYPVNPVITPEELRVAIGNMHADLQDNALVYAFAAVTINLTHTSGDVTAQVTYLLRSSLRAHRQAEFGGGWSSGEPAEVPATPKRAMTCIFLEISFMAFKLFDRALAILREAIALIQMLHVDEHARDGGGGGVERLERPEVARRQRLYWEAYIHERFLCTVSGYPCVLPPLRAGMPLEDATISAPVDAGFTRLISLFLVMDPTFLAYWSGQDSGGSSSDGSATPVASSQMTASWIETKQAQLDADEAATAAADAALAARGRDGLTEIQHADLFVTRLWLRTLVWQLALSRGFLRSAPPHNTHEGLSLHFPAQRLSAQLRSLVARLETVASIAIHGSGILQKLFEVTSTVADVLALPLGHGQTQHDARSRIEDFVFIVRFLFSFERIQKEQRDYLREKLDVLQTVYTIVDFGTLASGSPGTS